MVQRVNDDFELEQLLLVWGEARERGELLTVEQLCRNHPELATELGRRIHVQFHCDPLAPNPSTQQTHLADTRAVATASLPSSVRVTAELGDLQFHDHGGLGVIFKARHKELPRDVAIKFIRHDQSDDPRRAARFLREAQITARLEHPGIVPIYGLGRDDGGKLCYAMRFIKGETLDRKLRAYHDDRASDRGKCSLETDRAFRMLLQRFKAACTTIAYAHSRGVLHRDIKPSNIMLGPFDETLILDWGLGKKIAIEETGPEGRDDQEDALNSPGSDETQTDGVIGTPGFMSPEQHAGQRGKVGPASDVFSLGATLYVLLTGRAPFQGVGPGEVAAKVMRGEFTAPRREKPDIPRPLEAVCLKAMALAPDDRYRSASAMADDIEDWLAGEPVRAWREPWPLRARRRIARHRTLVTSGAVAAFLVLIGLITILVQQSLSNRRLAVRNTQMRQAQGRAERRLDLALTAIDRFRGVVAENSQLKYRPEFGSLRKNLLAAPQEFFRQIKQDIEEAGDGAPDARAGLVKVIFKLADMTAEIDSRPIAIRTYQEGLDNLKPLLQNRADFVELRVAQGRALLALARLERDEGDLASAAAGAEQGRQIFQSLSGAHPQSANHRIDLAEANDELGLTHARANRSREAEVRFETARAILEKLDGQSIDRAKHLGRHALVFNHLGMIQRSCGRHDEALTSYTRALDFQATLARERADDPWVRSTLASIYYNIGNLRRESGRGNPVESYERANEIYEPLVRECRSVAEFRILYARSLGNIAMLTSGERGKFGTISAFAKIADLQREAVEIHPGVVRYRLDLATTLFHLARLNLGADRPHDALSQARDGVNQLETILTKCADSSGQVTGLLAAHWAQCAEALATLGRGIPAAQALQNAITHQRVVITRSFSDDDRFQLFSHHYHLAALQMMLGQTGDAGVSLDAMQPLWPKDPNRLLDLALELARGWPRATADRGGQNERSGTPWEKYDRLLLATIDRSLRSGLQHCSILINDPAFRRLNACDQYRQMIVGAMDRDFPSNPLKR